MLWGDEQSRWRKGLFDDRRVVQYWDPDRTLGAWFGRHLANREGLILWDAYALYDAKSRWQEAPTHLISWGRTIISNKERLLRDVMTLLEGS